MRRSFSAVLAVLGLVLLSGCFKVDTALTVSDDDSVSGTMVFAIEESLASMAAESDEDLFSADDLPDGATVEEYAQDGMVGQKATFTDVPLAELTAAFQEDEGDFSLTRDGDEFVFDASFSPQQSAGSAPPATSSADAEFAEGMEQMMQQALSTAEVHVEITFPGEIKETNGEVDGTTVSWDPDVTEGADMHAVAATESGGVLDDVSAAAGVGDDGFPVTPMVIGAVVLVGLGVGGAWLLSRRTTGA